MSYKTIKRLLGETSLERKCRFLFGSGLLLLITGSFYFYASQTTKLIDEQNLVAARLLVAPIIMEKHWKWSENRGEFSIAEDVAKMAVELKPPDMKKYNWTLSKAGLFDSASRPPDDAGYRALERISKANGEREVIVRLRNKLDSDTNRKYEEFNYYAGVYATDTCVACHRQHNGDPELKTGDLIGMVKITFPLDKTQRALAWNNAILLATAIVTAFLAMLAAYAIVRYVIVKPVLHLKDVSDAIARGSLDQRADIRTGDEFEELSHAFNRMLRHLVTVQEELQQLNRGYEVKVDELAQANLRLYELNNLKNEFLATMSHELRTPLNSILGFSDVLVNAQGLTDKQRRYVSNIQTSGKNLLNLINDVLDLAKIEAGKMELHIVEFSIADLIERLVAQMSPLAEKKSIDLGWDVDPGVPLVMQDSGKIEQILSNLMSNAIKFTPEGGRVRVRAERRDKVGLALIVEDTGIGIPLEEQEKIFEKFRQGKGNPGQTDTLTREYEGTGLGLSIIRELSKLLGGDVRVESEFGRGSVFSVLIPARLDPEHPPKVVDDFHPRPLSRPEPPVRALIAVQPSLAALEP
ncbi:sensor histidine kinase [Planctellipticum variicoloris]|uniref:sensor histidine kinase n=1 Tax=Planctellipticum variicoloris TaxID=3064265 RepID=UPI0030140A9D|nr:ATP-binding protein [Planctomycetaceae bacterium SH412]